LRLKKRAAPQTLSTELQSVPVPPPAPELPPVRTPAPEPVPVRTSADDLTRAVVRQWRVAALVAAAITLLAWLAAAVQPKRYRATSIGAVTPISENLSPTDILRGVDSLDRRVIVASLAALAAAPVTQRLTQAGSDYTIAGAVMPNTNLVRIEVEGTNARRTAEIANRVPSVLGAQARAMYRMYGVTLISEATAPEKPALPRVGRALAAGLVLGVLLGIATAWILDRSDNRRRSA
jgi:uncharacterized protein involved in exopolysaccharide biosynthesis